MFPVARCCAEGCQNKALFRRETCYIHLDDREGFLDEIKSFLEMEEKIENLELSGITLEDLDIGGKEISFCNLSHVRLSRARFNNIKIRLCYFDFSSFTDCEGVELDIRHSAFAGSQMTRCRFNESDLIRCNFAGLKGQDSLFDSCNLYDSRFISALLEKTRFHDCDLKRVYFNSSKLTNVTFPSSNAEDAYFIGTKRYP